MTSRQRGAVVANEAAGPRGAVQAPALCGYRCTDCLLTIFPGTDPCAACGGRATQVPLSSTGMTESFTTTVTGTTIAEVRLDDGVLVLGRLEAPEPAVGLQVVLASNEEVAVYVPQS